MDKNFFPDAPRYEECIDFGYKFLLSDLGGGEDPDLDDSSWRTLNLPHDWSIEGEYDKNAPCGGCGGFLPTGIGWYRKRLTVAPHLRDGRSVYLRFDGVFCNSTVFVDGVVVGGREYGWLSFTCDITEQVRGKETVLVAVRVDNSVQPAARWFTGSGIYSHVTLISLSQIHVPENGVRITTPAEHKCAPDGRAVVEVTVENRLGNGAVTVKNELVKKGDGTVIARCEEEIFLDGGESRHVTSTLFAPSPELWSHKDPSLYTVVTTLTVGNETLDAVCTDFGFRSVSYDENGLYFNGLPIKLKGVSNHWALGAIGAAQSENIIRHKILMMKKMGANAIRTSHNACPPEFYRLCDEVGMMVMDELFEGERGKVRGDYGTRWFKEKWKSDVEYWVKRDRNHPCVVLWSIGNETGSENDNTGIAAHIRLFDTSRPITGSRIYTGVDIPGANGISEYRYFDKPPIEGLPVVCAEGPHTHAVRGVYKSKTSFRGNISEGDNSDRYYLPHLTERQIFGYDWSSDAAGARGWPSSYDNCVSTTSVRKHWTLTRDDFWRVGEFRWTGFDYVGEADYVVGGWPYRMFHTGAVDTALFEKDMYYLYQSMWSDEPMLHILPSWTHPNIKKGTEIPVWVYSNCHTVELFLNGRSVGRQTRGDVKKRSDLEMQFDFYLPYEEGELIAVGYTDGRELARERLVTASAPARICLENEDELPLDPRYVGKVRVKITDSDGNFYPYGENRIYFATVGSVSVKALDNGSPTDVESHVNGNRTAFMGLCRAFVSPTGRDGDAFLVAASILGEKRQLTSDLVSIDVKGVSLKGNPEIPEYEIFYTLDGTTPSRAAEKYLSPFRVSLGTTVRAAVYTVGENNPILIMSERFGENEGMYWELGEMREGGQRRTVVTVDASCIKDTRIRADGLRATVGGADGSESEKWQMITDIGGLISFINMENGGALVTNGSAVFIGQNGLFDTGKWLRVGEAEHYDYIVHAATGKVIAVSDGNLVLSDKRSFNDADMLSSPAFWDIKETKN